MDDARETELWRLRSVEADLKDALDVAAHWQNKAESLAIVLAAAKENEKEAKDLAVKLREKGDSLGQSLEDTAGLLVKAERELEHIRRMERMREWIFVPDSPPVESSPALPSWVPALAERTYTLGLSPGAWAIIYDGIAQATDRPTVYVGDPAWQDAGVPPPPGSVVISPIRRLREQHRQKPLRQDLARLAPPWTPPKFPNKFAYISLVKGDGMPGVRRHPKFPRRL
jgi:hypothetical protein